MSKAGAKSKPKTNVNAIYDQVISSLLSRSEKEIRFSNISRWCKVPRSTLYYYFGSSVSNLLEESIRYGVRSLMQFYELEQCTHYRSWQDFERARLNYAAKFIQEKPWIPAFYFRFRWSQSKTGQTIREVEVTFAERIKAAWVHFNQRAPHPAFLSIAAFSELAFVFGCSVQPPSWSLKDGVNPNSNDSFQEVVDFYIESIGVALRKS